MCACAQWERGRVATHPQRACFTRRGQVLLLRVLCAVYVRCRSDVYNENDQTNNSVVVVSPLAVALICYEAVRSVNSTSYTVVCLRGEGFDGNGTFHTHQGDLRRVKVFLFTLLSLKLSW